MIQILKGRRNGLAIAGVIAILILLIRFVFFAGYAYYKNPTASNLINAISLKLPEISLKARNQLYCKNKFRGLDECYVVLLIQSSPEEIIKNKVLLEKLVPDFIKQEEMRANKFEELRFTITEVKFSHNDDFVFIINTRQKEE